MNPTIRTAPLTFNFDSDTIWAACRWIFNEFEVHRVTNSQARLPISASKSLLGILPADEAACATCAWVEANLDDITHRWVNGMNGDPKTVQTYKTRVEKLLDAFKDRCANPTTYRSDKHFGTRTTTEKKPKIRGELRAVQEVAAEPTPALPTIAASTPSSNSVSIPIGARQVATLALPFDFESMTPGHVGNLVANLGGFLDLTVADIQRIVARVLPTAVDYDPTISLGENLNIK